MNANFRLDQWVSGLLDASLKSSVILLASTLLVVLLRKKSAALRHLIWTLAVGVTVLMPVFTVILPAWRLNVLPPPHLAAQDVSPRGAPVSEGRSTPRTILAQNSAGAPTRPETSFPLVSPPVLVMEEQLQPVFASTRAAPAVSPPNVPATHTRTRWPFAAWIAVAWLAGAAVVGFVWLIGMIAVQRAKRRSIVCDDARLNTVLRQLLIETNIRRSVRLLLSQECQMPMAWGLFWPTIMLPQAAVQWPSVRARAIALHELSHIRRWDYTTEWLSHLARTIYWFNPLTWWAHHRMRAEQERACDDAVLGHGAAPMDYAQDLVDVARTLSGRRTRRSKARRCPGTTRSRSRPGQRSMASPKSAARPLPANR